MNNISKYGKTQLEHVAVVVAFRSISHERCNSHDGLNKRSERFQNGKPLLEKKTWLTIQFCDYYVWAVLWLTTLFQ